MTKYLSVGLWEERTFVFLHDPDAITHPRTER